MIARLIATAALVALFAVTLSFLVQDGTQRPGSAFASAHGGDCSYEVGEVCTISRDTSGPHTF